VTYELDQIEGKWKQIKGTVRQKWAKLTDDDWNILRAIAENFAGRLQERYGIAKDEESGNSSMAEDPEPTGVVPIGETLNSNSHKRHADELSRADDGAASA